MRHLERRQVPVHPDVLVVGAGISGIHAALTLANAGKHVYLVEREPSIGGHMAMFDKTFPTLDCAACILTPKMVQLAQHPNIELLAYSEVDERFGPRRQLQGQGPQEGLLHRRDGVQRLRPVHRAVHVEGRAVGIRPGSRHPSVVYTPFPQAVPRVPVIDRAGTSPCTFACPAGTQGARLRVTDPSRRVREGVQRRARGDAAGRDPRSRLLRALRDAVQPRRPGGPAADPQAQAIRRRHPLPQPRSGDRGPAPERQSRWR